MIALVTGAGGFLGRSLTERLLAMKMAVHTLSLSPIEDPRVTTRRADITRLESLEDVPPGFWGKGPRVLFHLAGLADKEKCQQSPLRAVHVNVMGTAHIAEMCLRYGIERVVFPSTGLVYASDGLRPLLETDALRPASVYAATKLAAETLLQGYATRGLKCTVVRLGNLYGFGAPANTIVPTILLQILRKKPVSIKTLRPSRDFLYVEDAVEGLIGLALRNEMENFQVFNLGSGRGTTIKELLSIILRITEQREGIETPVQEAEQADVSNFILSCEKLSKETGFRPSWTLDEGLKETWEKMQA